MINLDNDDIVLACVPFSFFIHLFIHIYLHRMHKYYHYISIYILFFVFCREDVPIQKEADPSSSSSSSSSKASKIITRSITAILMASAYVGLLAAGHFYTILSMVLTQTECYRELVNIRYTEAQEKKMPWFRTLQWAWFFVPMINVYGDTLHNFCRQHKQLFWLTSLTTYISSTVFVSYCLLFVISVGSLKKGLVKYQISQFMWSIVTVCLVVLQCKLYATNVLNGIFWFCFPMMTVMMNDVSAYFCGITMGRRFIQAPFLALSPNKTVRFTYKSIHLMLTIG